jgi:hypothetical protein
MAVTVHSGSVDSLFALEPGIDGLLATADDPAPVTLLTGPFIGQLAMGRGAILFETQACSSCAFVWNVISAGPGGSFQTGTTSIVLPNSSNAAISADGSAVAWASPGSGSVLSVRTTGPNGRFDASDDVVITRPMPANLVPGMMAIDGTRLVVLGRDSSTNTDWIVRWDAGADGIWGTADDVIERSHGSPGLRVQPSLSSGLLAFVQNGDVLAFDLSTLRWESAPAGGAQFLASNGAGTLFWTENGRMKARSPSGIERAGPFVSSSGFRMFDAAAADLVAIDPNTLGVSAYNPDASGLYFTASAPSGKIYSTTNSILSVGTGGGKAIVKEISSASTRFYRIIEPRGGALRDAATLGRVVNAGSDTCANCTNSLAITSRQALVSCDNAYLCVYNAGIDGEFGTADDPPPVHLNHATGSPAAGRAINPYRFRASSSTLAFVEAVGPGPTFYVLSAGPDGVFGTSDDREALVENFLNGYDHFSVVGDRVAFPLNGAPGGDQVLVLNGVGGSLVTVTHHYSVKTSTALDLSGRVYWIDSAFAPAGIFSYIP